ncbi:hypothetical protein PYW07_012731 [Mythimna separata]|uniref:Uncharacterized protein n=1 Tax=Mythimna separata TaxID=271217 RepID=A0AAD7Y8J2_MYTSE|nr:hypothetical protein PYW07_012731 [Mythimna separata]
MSSRSSRKAANPRAKAPEPIITRTKSAQQRRKLRNKEEKKTEKPELTKTETKSPKVKTVKRPQESLLKVPIVIDSDECSQLEFYPNTLKRDVPAKKIMLKPKHNFKVIASTNKRKLAIPQRGHHTIKSPSSKPSPPKSKTPRSKRPIRCSSTRSSSPELSMHEMIRMMEETRSLSDDDFMEILTCPSPVWWEDPPDGGFDEDSIHKKLPEPPPERISNPNKKRRIITNTKSTNSNKITNKQHQQHNNSIHKKPKDRHTDEKFVKKKQKLENILGNIKNKTTQPKNDEKSVDKHTNRKVSESEEGDISDLSFNEEEILKNLEEMEIPMERSDTEESDLTDPLDIKNQIDDIDIKEEMIGNYNNDVTSKNDNLDREILSIEIKKESQEELLIKSSVFRNEFTDDDDSDEISSAKTSDDVVILDTNTNSSSSITDDLNRNKSVKVDSSNDLVPNKKTKDLSEFITVYKITPDKLKNDTNSEKPKNGNGKQIKMETVRGKLNDFFKHCKSSMRLKKMENAVPAISVTDVKKDTTEKENKISDGKTDSDGEKNRLKTCDYCVEKSENGTTDFSCDKCESAPIQPCGLCNFVADSKEVYKKHVSSCKDVARISWSHNYVLNQT